jgi:hypothetical protein
MLDGSTASRAFDVGSHAVYVVLCMLVDGCRGP